MSFGGSQPSDAMMSVSFTIHSQIVGANFSSVHFLRSGALDVSNTSFAEPGASTT